MPATTTGGKPRKEELPSTIQRSDSKAQRTYAKTHDSAAEEYGDGERAHRTAFSALKHTHEKVGDHWEPKPAGRKGPSDAHAAGGRNAKAPTKGGVDANAPKTHLMELAKKADIRGRTRMSKPQLVDALQKSNNRETAKARNR
jgi:cation transport regulator ChaB